MIVPQNPFVFVIPVRNPEDKQVQNYGTIELLLEKTITSLCKQRNRAVHVIVVCHRIPKFAAQLPDNVTFLDITDSSVFLSGRNPVRVDKGLKYIIGILYAARHFKPDFIMPMDADDFIHRDLVDYIHSLKSTPDETVDGYMVQRGAHVLLDVKQGTEIYLHQAFHIRDFNITCGSCRIFNFSRLVSRLFNIHPNLEDQFKDWPTRDLNKRVIIPNESIQWLDSITSNQYNDTISLVNALGRHMNQRLNFKLTPLRFAGAAKGCGHGNHDGPLKGDVHENKIIGIYPIRKFLVDFGLTGIADISDKHMTLINIIRLPKYYLLQLPIYLVSIVKKRLTNTYTY